MILDRSGNQDPRNERKGIAKSQQEINSILSRIADNTEERNNERFKEQAVRSSSMSRMFEKQQSEQTKKDMFQPAEDGKNNRFGGSTSRPESTYMKVLNFRDGLVIPITEYFDMAFRDRMEFDRAMHKENIFQLRMIDQKVQALIPKGQKTLGQRMREGFNDYLKAPIWNTFKKITTLLYTTISGALKFLGKGLFKTLFGGSKKERSTVKAIDEQTEFLRKGFIDRDRSLFEKIKDGGLLGSAARAGFGALTGLSERTANQAQQRAAQGKQLSLIEKAANKMHKSNVDLLDMNEGQQQTDRQIQEDRNTILNSTMNIIQMGMQTHLRSISSIRETVLKISSEIKTGTKSIYAILQNIHQTIKTLGVSESISSYEIQKENNNVSNPVVDNNDGFKGLAATGTGGSSDVVSLRKQNQTNETNQSNVVSMFRDVIESSSLNQTNETNQSNVVSIEKGETGGINDSLKSFNEKQEKLVFETEQSNSPWMSPFEEQMIGKLTEQSNILRESNELQQESMEPEKRSGGGLLGLAAMGVGWLGAKIGTWIKRGVMAAGPYILSGITSGFAIAASQVAIAGAFGYAIGTYVVNPFINKIDEYFGTDIGHAIGKATYFLVEGVKDLFNSPIQYTKEMFTSMGTMLMNSAVWLGKQALNIITWPFTKMWEGIKGAGEWIVSKAKEIPVIGDWITGSDSPSQTPGVSERGPASGGGPPIPNSGNVDDMNNSAQQTDSELKKQMQQQTQESKSLREQMAEQNERMLQVLEQINGNSAATAANSGGNSEDKVFLRKDQQFTFEGSPL